LIAGISIKEVKSWPGVQNISHYSNMEIMLRHSIIEHAMAYSSFDEFEGLLKDEIGAKVFQRQTLSNYKDANIFKPKRESATVLFLTIHLR